MCSNLPSGDFKWLSEEEVNSINVLNIDDDASTGYILECDINIPQELHDTFADYPPCPEKLLINDDMISPYSKQVKDNLGLHTFQNTAKLAPNLLDKKHYVIHYTLLKVFLRMGCVLDTVHRVVSFSQSKWLAPYINSNTNKRKLAKNKFERDFYKLMNNSCYGKFLECKLNHQDIKLVTCEKKMRKQLNKACFHSCRIFNEDLVGVRLNKPYMLHDIASYVGFCVLDISKIIMYQFFYDFLKPKYGSKVQLVYTDTDSFILNIETEDVYADFSQCKEHFDFSDYPTDHPLYDVSNKKVVGKWSDETGGAPITEVVALKSKMYSFTTDSFSKQTAKGVTRGAVRKHLKHDAYQNVLKNCLLTKTKMNQIKAEKHQLYTLCINKTSLTAYDDKRYILDDGVYTLPHGHYYNDTHNNLNLDFDDMDDDFTTIDYSFLD